MNETHEDFAMKVFSKQILLSKKDAMVKDAETGRLKHKNYLEEIKKEIEIMKQLNATNVVRLKEGGSGNQQPKCGECSGPTEFWGPAVTVRGIVLRSAPPHMGSHLGSILGPFGPDLDLDLMLM